MPTDTAFRLSTYLTLAAACAALGVAEYSVLPEVGVFAAVVVLALAVIYRLETRVQLLSLSAANNLGAGLGLAGALWIGYRVVREIRDGAFASMGWAMFFVMLTAPVLMAAVAAKLLRREKHAGDYWYLHVAALGSVTLAGAMSRDTTVQVLIAAYALFAVWNLARFAHIREADLSGPGPGPTRVALLARRAWWLAPALPLAWVAVAAAVAAPLVSLTPKSPFAKWEFGTGRIEIGYAGEQLIDLNRTGELEANEEAAFTVAAEYDDGQPKNDLNLAQLWRGAVLTRYHNGRWEKNGSTSLPPVEKFKTARSSSPTNPWSPPQLGPGQFALRFSVPAKLRAQPLADPVDWVPGEPAPVADLPPGGGPNPWYALSDGTFMKLAAVGPNAPDVQYVQYTRPPAEPGVGPPFALDPATALRLEGKSRPPRPGPGTGLTTSNDPSSLTDNPLPRVREYADRVLDQLVRDGQLPPQVRDRVPASLHVRREHHEAVARAFEKHLSESREFTYTTKLERTRKDLDPVEEFLLHSRSGHCERFATGLLMMLRSQGIPAVLVIGFRGCNSIGDGRYEIRNENAHSWVSALISRPAGGGDRAVWHWVNLDPSPIADAERQDDADGGSWWVRLTGPARAWLLENVIDATPDRRLETLKTVAANLTEPAALGGVAAVVALVVGVRVLLRRRFGSRPPEARAARWLDPLFAALAPFGHAPTPGETPREFAARVADALGTAPATVAVAGVPGEWAEAYYQARFGGTPVADARRAELDARLDALRHALAGSRNDGDSGRKT